MGARQSSTQGSVSNTSSPRVQGSGSSSNSGSNIGLNGPNSASGSNSHTTSTTRQHRTITHSSTSSSSTATSNRHQTGSNSDSRQRSRSFANGNSNNNNGTVNVQSIMTIPKTNEGFIISTTPDSDTSTEEMPFGRAISAHSLPVQFINFNVVKCPVCSKTVPPEDVECHLVMCLTKPRISYNEDVLNEDKGECVICLDDLSQGDTIARLPCLCIYHKSCIDAWFEVNRSCPEHPSD